MGFSFLFVYHVKMPFLRQTDETVYDLTALAFISVKSALRLSVKLFGFNWNENASS